MTFENPLFEPPLNSFKRPTGTPSEGFCPTCHNKRCRRVESAAIPRCRNRSRRLEAPLAIPAATCDAHIPSDPSAIRGQVFNFSRENSIILFAR